MRDFFSFFFNFFVAEQDFEHGLERAVLFLLLAFFIAAAHEEADDVLLLYAHAQVFLFFLCFLFLLEPPSWVFLPPPSA